jgi:hypothetical protein
VFQSSSYVREARAHHQLKSFGRDSVRSAGSWPAMADGYGYKGMVFTGVRSAV